MITLSSYNLDIPKSSHDARNVATYVSTFYKKSTGFISGLGNALLVLFITPFAFFIMIPIALILLGLIKFNKWKLKKALKNRLNIKISSYKDTKRIQNNLSSDLIEIENVINLISNKSAWFDSLFISDIKDLYNMLLNFEIDLNKSLSNLSYYESSDSLKHFDLITEDALWKTRTEAYQYRL